MADISLKDIEQFGACEEALSAFAERFPNGCSYRDLILALADHEEGIEWWEWLAPQVSELRPMLKRYEAAARLMLERYKSVERSALEQYLAVERPAWQQYLTELRQTLREIGGTQDD